MWLHFVCRWRYGSVRIDTTSGREFRQTGSPQRQRPPRRSPTDACRSACLLSADRPARKGNDPHSAWYRSHPKRSWRWGPPSATCTAVGRSKRMPRWREKYVEGTFSILLDLPDSYFVFVSDYFCIRVILLSIETGVMERICMHFR